MDSPFMISSFREIVTELKTESEEEGSSCELERKH